MCKISGVKFSSKFFSSIKGTASEKITRTVINYGLFESAILSIADEPKFDPPYSIGWWSGETEKFWSKNHYFGL